jgi:hypothetical protein
MQEVELPYKFYPRQWEALKFLSPDHPCEVVGYGGAKGGGKSHLGRSWQVLRRCKYAGSRGLLIRESFPELERTHIQKLKKELPPHLYNYVDRRHTFEFINGSVQEMAFVERAEDVESSYWGAEYDDIVVDEAQNHVKRVIQLLRSCLRTTSLIITPKMLLTFNWGGVGFGSLKKWFWRKWMGSKAVENDKFDTWENPAHWEENEKPGDFAFVRAKVYDNPSIMDNDPKYVERLMALPAVLRRAYLEGEPDMLEGQFFTEFGPHLRESPFMIEESDLMGDMFFGALDSGTTHPTVLGLYWLSGPAHEKKFGKPYVLHRLMTYKNQGTDIRGHAMEIKSRIEAFPWTHGHFPHTIAYDNQMDTVYKMNEYNQSNAIAEYKDVFQGKRTLWTPANKDKHNGCQIMRMMFSNSNEVPGFRYWDGQNRTFEEDIVGAITDKNDPEVYEKADNDDDCDSTRYGCMYGRALIAQKKQGKVSTDKVRAHNNKMSQMNWKDL